jgi:hypothetical protein
VGDRKSFSNPRIETQMRKRLFNAGLCGTALAIIVLAACSSGTSQEPATPVVAENQVQIVENAPDISGYNYRCIAMVRAVNQLRALGKYKSISILRAAADSRYEMQGKVALICRLLFVNPKGWTPPAMGDPSVNANAIGHWPIFPLANVGGVPFLLVNGYSGDGVFIGGWQSLEVCKNLEIIDHDLPLTGYKEQARNLINDPRFTLLYKNGSYPDLRIMTEEVEAQASGSQDTATPCLQRPDSLP